MRRRSKAAGCCLLVGTMAGAQQADAPAWPRVRVNVSVMDQGGAPAVGVKADALEVTDGKTVVQDAVLRPVGDAPESVCLLVDMSGSSFDESGEIHAELKEFLQKIPANDEVCLLDFSTSIYQDAPLTTNRRKVMDGISYLESSGGSAIRDALVSTARLMERQAHYSSRVILLVSDGGENASKSKEEAVRWELHRPEAPVLYSLVNSGGSTGGDRADQKRLEMLTKDTGGLAFPVSRQKDAIAAVDDLVQAMQGRYELEFTASDPTADGSERKLRVAAGPDLLKQKKYVVGADGYVAARQ